MNEKLTFPLELKELSETGEFVGIASPYGNKDLGNDIVERGAFSKTIAERGGKVRLMDSHKTRIGIAEVIDSFPGLQAKGRINLDKQAGREVYSDLKFYQEQGLPMGLSIGYKTVKADFDDNGVRHLKEVLLFEVSVTEIPMNEEALVTGVKDAKAVEELLEAMRLAESEKKAGRKISADTRRKLEAAMKEIEALLADEAAAESSTSSDEAAAKATEPAVGHSAIDKLLTEAKEAYKWKN